MTGWADAQATPITDVQAVLDALEAASRAQPDVWPISLIEYCRHQWWQGTGELLDWDDPNLTDLRDLARTHGTGVVDSLVSLRNATAYGPGDLTRALASFDPAAVKRRQTILRETAERCWALTRRRQR